MDKQKVPTGDCTVTYENSESAARAIEMFNNKDFNGAMIQVTPATPEQKQPFANKLVNYLNDRLNLTFNSSYAMPISNMAMEVMAADSVAVEAVAAEVEVAVVVAVSAEG